MMQTWTISEEPRGEIYKNLIRAAAKQGAVGGVVLQNFESYEASCANFLRELAVHTISVEETNEWPGTVLGGGNSSELLRRPELHKFRLNDDVVRLLTSYASGLYEWLYPFLPEDLCLFDNTGRVWLTTISHENDAYFTLTESELQVILALVPGLIGAWDAREPTN